MKSTDIKTQIIQLFHTVTFIVAADRHLKVICEPSAHSKRLAGCLIQ